MASPLDKILGVDPNAANRVLGVPTQPQQLAPLPELQEQERPSLPTEVYRGVRRGADQVVSDFQAAAAVGAAALGQDEFAGQMVDLALLREEQAREEFPVSVGRVEDIEGIGDFTRYAAGLLGEQTPIIASIIAGGGLGGVLGRLAGSGAMKASTAANLAARFGTIAGAGATATGLETGATALEQRQAIGEIDPGVAFLAGTAKGALESAVPLALGSRLGLTGPVAGRFFDTIESTFNRVVPARLAAAGTAATTEAVTETLQEVIDVAARSFVDEQYDVLGPEAASRLLNAASAGGLVGLVFGGIAGGRRFDEAGVVGEETPEPAAGTAGVPAGLAPTPVAAPITPGAAFAPDDVTPTEVDPTVEVSPLATPRPATAAFPEDLAEEVFITPAGTTDEAIVGQSVTQFLPGVDVAEDVQARGRRNVEVRKVSRADLAGRDVTATVMELPLGEPELTLQTPGVDIVPGSNVTAAMDEARAAIRERNEAIAVARAEGVTPDLTEADARLRNAIALGFRLRPQREGRGFIVVGEQPQTFPVTELDVEIPGRLDRNTPQILGSFPFVTARGENLFPLGTVARARLKVNLPASGTPRTQVDIDRIPRNRLTLVDPFRISDELGLDILPSMEQVQTAVVQAEQAGVIDGLQPGMAERLGVVFAHPSSDTNEVELRNLLNEGLRIHPQGEIDPTTVAVIGEPPLAATRELPRVPPSRSGPPKASSVSPLTLYDLLHEDSAGDPRTRKAYDPAAHKEGTAKWVEVDHDAQPASSRAIRERRRAMQRVEAFYTAMMKKFNMRGKLVIVDGATASGESALGAGANGSFKGYADDHGLIRLDPLDSDVIGTASHEFGHYLSYTELTRAPEGLRKGLMNAYNRALMRVAFGSMEDFRGNFFPPMRFRGPTLDFASGENAAEAIANFTGDTDYWFSFDEWFADQVSRWVQTRERAPIDSVERFLKRIATKIRQLFESAHRLKGRSIEDFRPEPEVEAWIDSLQHNPVSIGQTAELEAQANGETDQASNHDSRVLASKLGLDRKTKENIDEARKLADKFNVVMKWGWNILQLGDKNKHIVWLQNYIEIADLWYNSKMQWMSRADTRVRRWRQVGKAENDRFVQFIFDVDQMKYLSRRERKQGVTRKPTPEELLALARKYELSPDTFNPDPDAPGIYQQLEGDFSAILDNMQRIVTNEVSATFADNEILRDLELARVQKEFDALRAKPYFPHSRFGDFTVVVTGKDGKTAYMEQFETERAARTARRDISKQYPRAQGFEVGIGKIPEEVQVFRGLPPSLLEMVRTRLELTPKQKIWLDRLIVDMSPSASFKKRLTKRENVPGYSLDAMRSYANYFWHAANHMARIEYGDQMQKTIDGGREDTMELLKQGFNTAKRFEILDFLQNHKDAVLNPGPDWAQLRSFAFQWWLGFSPASAALNFTQIPMVALPYLSARYNDVAAADALRKAMFNVKKLYLHPEKVLKDTTDADFRLIDLGVRQGFLEESQAMELAGIAEGANLRRIMGATKAQRAFMEFARLSSWMFQQSEKLNRRVVFRAAVELARSNPNAEYLQELRQLRPVAFDALVREEGLAPAEATAFLAGKDAVNRTQFEYASWARPRFMRGRKGALFTFYMFLQNMVWFTFNSPGNRRMLVMMLLMGGMMGMPGAEDLAAIAKMLARQMGEEFDVELETRKFITEIFGEDATIPPDLFLHGAGRIGFGMPAAFDAVGIPFPSFDMSANVSLGQIVPGVAELGPPGLDFEERFSRVSTDVAGAAFGIGLNFFKFLSDDKLPIDDAKRWERAVPRALRNVSRAVRFYTEERERTRTGATVVEFDPDDSQHMAEVIAQGMGFMPTRLARRWDRDMARKEVEGFWTIRRQMIMNQSDHAFHTRDKDAQRDTGAAVRRFNAEVPWPAMRITADNLRDSRRSRIRSRRLYELGRSSQTRNRQLGQEINELFPEVTNVEDASRMR